MPDERVRRAPLQTADQTHTARLQFAGPRGHGATSARAGRTAYVGGARPPLPGAGRPQALVRGRCRRASRTCHRRAAWATALTRSHRRRGSSTAATQRNRRARRPGSVATAAAAGGAAQSRPPGGARLPIFVQIDNHHAQIAMPATTAKDGKLIAPLVTRGRRRPIPTSASSKRPAPPSPARCRAARPASAARSAETPARAGRSPAAHRRMPHAYRA